MALSPAEQAEAHSEAEKRFNDARLATVVHAGLREYVPMAISAVEAVGWGAVAAFRDPVTTPPEESGKVSGFMWRATVGSAVALATMYDLINGEHPIEIETPPINHDVPLDQVREHPLQTS